VHDIVVVGNGTSVLKLKKGEWIDRHKTVVRINSAKIIDAETTGLKLNVWSTAHAGHLCGDAFNGDIVAVLANVKPGSDKASEIKQRIGNKNIDLFFLENATKSWLVKEYRAVTGRHNSFPTTGLVTLAHYLFDMFLKIDCIGFDGMIPGRIKGTIRSIHYGHKKKLPGASPHNPKAELHFLQKWHNEERINWIHE